MGEKETVVEDAPLQLSVIIIIHIYRIYFFISLHPLYKIVTSYPIVITGLLQGFKPNLFARRKEVGVFDWPEIIACYTDITREIPFFFKEKKWVD